MSLPFNLTIVYVILVFLMMLPLSLSNLYKFGNSSLKFNLLSINPSKFIRYINPSSLVALRVSFKRRDRVQF